jgi:GT2 family glycosyltransferase
VSVVVLAYNRRDQLLESLRQVQAGGYPAERLELIVVDNASTDGTAEAVTDRYPDVRLIRNAHNVGAPGWNAGFAVATGDYVLILDDDAYLPAGALERAVRAARAHDADLVSFSVVSSFDDSRRLNDDWDTGLLSFWGCAALLSAPALARLGGYDPELFIWANEAELTMRLLDGGFCHLHLPEVRAVHMKERIVAFEPRRYLVNARHHAYNVDSSTASSTIASRSARSPRPLPGSATVCAIAAAGCDRRSPWPTATTSMPSPVPGGSCARPRNGCARAATDERTSVAWLGSTAGSANGRRSTRATRRR